MRKFIVSDLHGDGNAYYSIMGYLENISKEDEVTLYINGDLIDRGYASAEILLDVKDRIENNKSFKIEYLGGNHELMMWDTITQYGDVDNIPKDSTWLLKNDGDITLDCLKILLSKEQINDVVDFVSNLKIYHKFEEKICDKNIVLVHAKCPGVVPNECTLTIKDGLSIYDLVWARREYCTSQDRIGHKNYFTIIGHTPTMTYTGYKYFDDQNYLNIDGGCSRYVVGLNKGDHIPLVEVENEKLTILTFDNNNEIMDGHYFVEHDDYPILDLENYRKYLNKSVKIKKRIFEDGYVFFK